MEPSNKDSGFSKFFHEIVDYGVWARLKGDSGKVFGVLLRHANYKTFVSKPTRETIARESGVNKNNITAGLKELEAFGLMKTVRGSRRFNFRNSYFLTPHPPAPAPALMKPKARRICPRIKDKCTGKFIKSTNMGQPTCPQSVANGTYPLGKDKKENEINKNIEKDSIGESPVEEILEEVKDPDLKKALLSLKNNLPVLKKK